MRHRRIEFISYNKFVTHWTSRDQATIDYRQHSLKDLTVGFPREKIGNARMK